MKKIVSLNLATIFTLIGLSYVAYYFLLQDNFLHISISSIIDYSHNLEAKKHLLVLGLLPVYIATMIFGTALFGLYLGSIFQQLLIQKAGLAGSEQEKNPSVRNLPSSM